MGKYRAESENMNASDSGKSMDSGKGITDEIYSIGYAGLSIEDFVRLLKQFEIDAVVDVRSNPHSRFHTDFDLERLRPCLAKAGIKYENYKEEFGARQTERRFMNEGGYLDFGLFSASDNFKAGYRRVSEGIDRGRRVCLMCAEKNPESCHRAIMVTRRFHEAGYIALHIMHDGSTLTQSDVEEKLVDLFFKNRSQISLFSEDNYSDEEYVDMAYKKQNEAISYRPDGEQGSERDGEQGSERDGEQGSERDDGRGFERGAEEEWEG